MDSKKVYATKIVEPALFPDSHYLFPNDIELMELHYVRANGTAGIFVDVKYIDEEASKGTDYLIIKTYKKVFYYPERAYALTKEDAVDMVNREADELLQIPGFFTDRSPQDPEVIEEIKTVEEWRSRQLERLTQLE